MNIDFVKYIKYICVCMYREREREFHWENSLMV